MSQELIINDGVIARAELDIQISTAKAYPRKMGSVMEEAIYLATMDEETAASCFYVLPRKDKNGARIEIKGPSIRLAEIMMNSWGNLHAATRITENDGRHITAEGVAWDLEKNNRVTMAIKTSIRFGEKDGKGGYTANTDMQTVLSNAASAKALRNAIFKVIPKALVMQVLEHAMKASIGEAKTTTSVAEEVINKLVKMGIERDRIFQYYDHTNINEFSADEVRSLIGLGTAIKEGSIKVDRAFDDDYEQDKGMSAAEKVNNLIKQKKENSNVENVQ